MSLPTGSEPDYEEELRAGEWDDYDEPDYKEKLIAGEWDDYNVRPSPYPLKCDIL